MLVDIHCTYIVCFCVKAKRALTEERETNKRQQVKLESNLTAAQKTNQELEVRARMCVWWCLGMHLNMCGSDEHF